MVTLSLHLKDLERPAALTMWAALSSPLSNTASNPFLCSFVTALDHALHDKNIDQSNPPVFRGGLETLTDTQVGQVVNVFDLFVVSFEFLGLKNAVMFCAQVREISSAEVFSRLARRNPPSRIFPELN